MLVPKKGLKFTINKHSLTYVIRSLNMRQLLIDSFNGDARHMGTRAQSYCWGTAQFKSSVGRRKSLPRGAQDCWRWDTTHYVQWVDSSPLRSICGKNCVHRVENLTIPMWNKKKLFLSFSLFVSCNLNKTWDRILKPFWNVYPNRRKLPGRVKSS